MIDLFAFLAGAAIFLVLEQKEATEEGKKKEKAENK